MKKAVIYARFSSDMQREESIDAQVRACREHCIRKGYAISNIYVDEAKSGRQIVNRDAYNRMMADATEHKFDVIVFHKLDRNARNEFTYYSFQHTLAQLDISYEYAAQPLDSSPEGRMMENVLVGMAAYYSRNLAKETKKGMNENAYQAKFNGGRPPLGYRIENQKYVIAQSEAEAVRIIFAMYLNGKGYGEIAMALKEKGYTTKDGRNFAKNSLHDILNNERYIGTYVFNKTSRKGEYKRNMHSAPSADIIKVEDAIPAIISKEDFAKVQAKRRKNQKRSGSYTAKEVYLLSGKIFCGCCGSAMCGHRMRPRNITYVYYSCQAKNRYSSDICQAKKIQRDPLEKWVLQTIEKEVLSKAGMENLARDMEKFFNENHTEMQNTLADLKADYAMQERKLSNIYSIIEDGAADEYDIKRLKETKAKLQAIKEKMTDYAYSDNLPLITKDEIEKTLMLLKQSIHNDNDVDAKKKLVELFVKKITVFADNVVLTLSTETVTSFLVPRTGIEPVRILLSEGF